MIHIEANEVRVGDFYNKLELYRVIPAPVGFHFIKHTFEELTILENIENEPTRFKCSHRSATKLKYDETGNHADYSLGMSTEEIDLANFAISVDAKPDTYGMDEYEVE